VITGNHDMLNEKGSAHALNFLAPYVSVVSRPVSVHGIGQLLPYFNDSDALKAVLAEIPPGSTIIMHQGVQTAYLGHYVQDKTSLPKEAFADFRVISGHYHRAQDIVCGRPRKGAVGLFSYIGNPYSLSFGEASDGPKGFQILGDDGLLTQVPTNLRKHVKLSNGTQEPLLGANTKINPGDLVWIQVTAPASELASINKKELGLRLGIGSNYRLDLIKTDVEAPKATTEAQSEAELLDALIDALPETDAQKKTLKSLWRDL
jgi:DNA repair exonuclease SbcCD nuclease subunit